ncbi:hypothetical protein CBR_g37569 [Chara braunii]|uniref:Uncharacterized protein n=1 Tax=Chara braunii TaxID=69332 RepID=A0A388LN78_CHABU|nr:hypothetical protein CBR_g37569 [Chara braunii]|eukprot:GBG83768.1 hypothetical protein CBR_g37569 [Chara braunii]
MSQEVTQDVTDPRDRDWRPSRKCILMPSQIEELPDWMGTEATVKALYAPGSERFQVGRKHASLQDKLNWGIDTSRSCASSSGSWGPRPSTSTGYEGHGQDEPGPSGAGPSSARKFSVVNDPVLTWLTQETVGPGKLDPRFSEPRNLDAAGLPYWCNSRRIRSKKHVPASYLYGQEILHPGKRVDIPHVSRKVTDPIGQKGYIGDIGPAPLLFVRQIRAHPKPLINHHFIPNSVCQFDYDKAVKHKFRMLGAGDSKPIVDTARTMGRGVPGPGEEWGQKTMFRKLSNVRAASWSPDVIRYRYSGGICPKEYKFQANTTQRDYGAWDKQSKKSFSDSKQGYNKNCQRGKGDNRLFSGFLYEVRDACAYVPKK